MGCGLATDDRSCEEGRHYTDQWRARLHSSGASDETRCCRIKRSQPSAAPTGVRQTCRSCRRLRSWRYQIHKTF